MLDTEPYRSLDVTEDRVHGGQQLSLWNAHYDSRCLLPTTSKRRRLASRSPSSCAPTRRRTGPRWRWCCAMSSVISVPAGPQSRSSCAATAITGAPRVLSQIQARYVILSAQLKRDFSSLSDAYKEAMIPATSGESELHLRAKTTALPVPIPPIEIHHVIATGFLALAVAIGSQGQDAPIHATESYEALTACWKIVSDEQLVEGQKW